MSGKRKSFFPDAWDSFTPDENRLHESYKGKELLLAELDIVGWLRFKKAMEHALHSDRHDRWFEILYMEHGQVDWWVESDSYNFSSGQVLVISPNELHGASCAVMQPCEHYWLRFAFPNGRPICGLSAGEQMQLERFFKNLPNRLLPGSDTVRNGFRQLIAAHHAPTPFSKITARCAFLTILCSIATEAHRMNPVRTSSPLSPRIQKAIRFLQDRLEEPPSVKEMASHAHMSEGTFRKLFEKETGIPPNRYLNIQRIRRAKSLMEGGCSVTDTAYALGFSSSQYFSTVFKKWAGISPSEFLSKPHRE